MNFKVTEINNEELADILTNSNILNTSLHDGMLRNDIFHPQHLTATTIQNDAGGYLITSD